MYIQIILDSILSDKNHPSNVLDKKKKLTNFKGIYLDHLKTRQKKIDNIFHTKYMNKKMDLILH